MDGVPDNPDAVNVTFASVKYAYANRPEVWPVAFNRNESPIQSHTSQFVTKLPLASATTDHAWYEESAVTVLQGWVRFFTLNTTVSDWAKPAPVKTAFDRGA